MSSSVHSRYNHNRYLNRTSRHRLNHNHTHTHTHTHTHVTLALHFYLHVAALRSQLTRPQLVVSLTTPLLPMPKLV